MKFVQFSLLALFCLHGATAEPAAWELPGGDLPMVWAGERFWSAEGSDLIRIEPDGFASAELYGTFNLDSIQALEGSGERVFVLYKSHGGSEVNLVQLDAESLETGARIRFLVEGFEWPQGLALESDDESLYLSSCSKRKGKCLVYRWNHELELKESFSFHHYAQRIRLLGLEAIDGGLLVYGSSGESPWAGLYKNGRFVWSSIFARGLGGEIDDAKLVDGKVLLAGSTEGTRETGQSPDLFVVQLDPSGKVLSKAIIGDADAYEGRARLIEWEGQPWVLALSRESTRGIPSVLLAPLDLDLDQLPFVVVASGAAAEPIDTGDGWFLGLDHSAQRSRSLIAFDGPLQVCEADAEAPTRNLVVHRRRASSQHRPIEVTAFTPAIAPSVIQAERRNGPMTVARCVAPAEIGLTERPAGDLVEQFNVALNRRVGDALTAGRFDELESLAQQLLAERDSDPTDWWSLQTFYQTFTSKPEPLSDYALTETVELTRNWHRARPESTVAATAHAIALEALAWYERGALIVRTTSDRSSADRFDERIEEAWRAIESTPWAESADPELFRMRMVLARVGASGDFRKAHEQAIAISGDYHSTYVSAASYMRPSWYGSWEQVGSYFTQMVERNREAFGDRLLPRFAIVCYLWTGSPTAIGLDWNRTKKAFLELFEAYPETTRLPAWAARLALAQDDEAFLEEIRAHGRFFWDIHAREIFGGDETLFRKAAGIPAPKAELEVPRGRIQLSDESTTFTVALGERHFDVGIDQRGVIQVEAIQGSAGEAFELETSPRVTPAFVLVPRSDCPPLSDCAHSVVPLLNTHGSGGGNGLFDRESRSDDFVAVQGADLRVGLPVVNSRAQVFAVLSRVEEDKAGIEYLRPAIIGGGHVALYDPLLAASVSIKPPHTVRQEHVVVELDSARLETAEEVAECDFVDSCSWGPQRLSAFEAVVIDWHLEAKSEDARAMGAFECVAPLRLELKRDTPFSSIRQASAQCHLQIAGKRISTRINASAKLVGNHQLITVSVSY